MIFNYLKIYKFIEIRVDFNFLLKEKRRIAVNNYKLHILSEIITNFCEVCYKILHA